MIDQAPKEEGLRRGECEGLRFIIAAGGTGGHLFPGIAIARELQERSPGAHIRFVVGRREMESRIPAEHGYECVQVDAEGLKGRGWKKGIAVLFKLPKGVIHCAWMIRRFAPSLVLGMGSYAAGPVCLAARLLGIPTAIHEQNSFPGLANRLLGRIVDKVFISFEESREYFTRVQPECTGNPVRKELLNSPAPRPQDRVGFTVLVLGGSQGAAAVNDAMLQAVTQLKGEGRHPRVIHQTGQADFERIRDAYAERGVEAETAAFIRDMGNAYGRADVVVSRAGATTVFELAALGKPSVLIPYPYAANQHQEINAMSLARGGAAEMIRQGDLDGGTLARVLARYMDYPDALADMGRRAKAMGRPEAAATIVDRLLTMVN